MSVPEPATPPLRILIAHQRAARRGGVDIAVDDEAVLLQRRGHELRLAMRDAADGADPHRVAAELGTMLDEFQPELVHLHERDLGVAEAVCAAAARRRVPLVWTLHDYALLCPQRGLCAAMRPCEACVGRLPWRAATRGCLPDRAAAAAAAARLVRLRAGGLQHRVARWIVGDAFAHARFVAGGLPPQRLRVHASGVELPALEEMPRQGFLFVGRLDPGQGLDVVAEAFGHEFPQSALRLAGSGPEAPALDGRPRLQLLGQITTASVYEEMRRAVALVLPGTAPMHCPRVLVEAFALGLPVIASRAGALPTLVEEGRTGLLFSAGSGVDLAAKLHWAENHPDRMYAMGLAARLQYEREYSHDAAYRRLAAIYAEAAAGR